MSENRISSLFESKKRNILNIFFMAGFPQKESTVEILQALQQAGADMVEVGMPYSDPVADGTVIQEISKKALQNGITIGQIFKQVKTAREVGVKIPILLMGYYNQLLAYGENIFLRHCKSSQIDGLIIPDMPPDVYKEQHIEQFKKQDLKISFLITPQTSQKRIDYLAKLSSAFLYIVSSNATTGKKGSLSQEQETYFQRIAKMNLTVPTLIGFGISDNNSLLKAFQYASGGIVGSAFLEDLRNKPHTKNLHDFCASFVHNLRGNRG